jgi:hypothetical protein
VCVRERERERGYSRCHGKYEQECLSTSLKTLVYVTRVKIISYFFHALLSLTLSYFHENMSERETSATACLRLVTAYFLAAACLDTYVSSGRRNGVGIDLVESDSEGRIEGAVDREVEDP